MDALINAANSAGVRSLIDLLYDIRAVQGFALDVHAAYLDLYRQQYGSTHSVNDILKSSKQPSEWSQECIASGYPANLSPIYVAVYVTMPEDAFRATYPFVPTTVPPGHAVVIETVTPFAAQADRNQHRPIQGGISVGNSNRQETGTLGGFFEEDGTTNLYLVSCTHVLSDGHCLDIVQQGTRDGGMSPNDSVASIFCAPPLQAPVGFAFNAPYNTVDAAIAKVSPHINVSPNIRRLNRVTGTVTKSQLQLGDPVVFVGKESDDKRADVFRFIARAKVTVDGSVYNFGDIFEISSRKHLYVGSLSKPGDSGSWVMRENPVSRIPDEVCGMLFAGNGKTSLCCFMETVLASFQSSTPMGFRVH